MRDMKAGKTEKFLFFALPCYGLFLVLFVVLGIWKVSLIDPDVIATMLLIAAIIIAAVLLVNNHYEISIPMIIIGIYIFNQDDQFIGDLLRFYGGHLILHYLICGVLVYRGKNGQHKSYPFFKD